MIIIISRLEQQQIELLHEENMVLKKVTYKSQKKKPECRSLICKQLQFADSFENAKMSNKKNPALKEQL